MRYFRFSGTLCSVDWLLVANVLGQLQGPGIGLWNMRLAGCLETSVTNYQYTLRNIPKSEDFPAVTGSLRVNYYLFPVLQYYEVVSTKFGSRLYTRHYNT